LVLVVILVFVATVTAIVIWFGYRIYKWNQEEYQTAKRIQERQEAALESATERLRDQMSLPSLINFNQKLLDKYHRIATEQAESSFRSSRRAMWCGFGWLLACFTVGVFFPTTAQAKLLLGSLAVTGGALSGFLSRTYIHVYERALEQLDAYFDQPLLNSYLLSAERIIDVMDEHSRDDAYRVVIERLLSVSSRRPRVDRATKPQRSKTFTRRSTSSPDGASGEVGQEASDALTDRNVTP
jgi:hypothetical protein